MNFALKKKLFELYKAQPWLAEKEEKLAILLEAFADDQKQFLIFHLLYEFRYVNVELFKISLREIVENINEIVGEKADQFQICAATLDRDADSGQWLIYSLKSEPLSRLLVEGVPLKNTIAAASSGLLERPNLIIIDEFSGTGKTILSRIKYIRGREKEIQLSVDPSFKVNVSVFLIAGMEEALKKITPAADVVHFSIKLKKGISDRFSDTQKGEMISAMEEIEEAFFVNADFHRFGYGRSESLYAREDGNIPNNVFPVFWWNHMKNNKKWSPLFYRRM